MPELPEVEITRRQLEGWTAGTRVVAVAIPDPMVVRSRLSTRPADALPGGAERLCADLAGTTPDPPTRHGKRLGWRFRGAEDAAVLVHLGMSGKWVRRDADTPRHGRLRLDLSDGTRLWFVDPRRFGCVVPVAPARLHDALRDGLGPDALHEPPDGNALSARLASRSPVKVVLLDQARLAGVGNIQAVEALWRARVHPGRPATALTAAEWSALAAAIPQQLARTIAAEDDGELRYLSERGADNPFSVYGRAGEPCLRCGTALARTVHAGRATFWCPGCQA